MGRDVKAWRADVDRRFAKLEEMEDRLMALKRVKTETVKRMVLRTYVAELTKMASAMTLTPCPRPKQGEKRCADQEIERRERVVASYKGGPVPADLVAFRVDLMCDECAALEHVNRAIRRLEEALRS